MLIVLLIFIDLRTFTEHLTEVTVEGRTVARTLVAFALTYSDLRLHLCNEKRCFVLLY